MEIRYNTELLTEDNVSYRIIYEKLNLKLHAGQRLENYQMCSLKIIENIHNLKIDSHDQPVEEHEPLYGIIGFTI